MSIGVFLNFRPEGVGIFLDFRPEGIGIFLDFRPEGAGIFLDFRPEGVGIFLDFRPEGAGIFVNLRLEIFDICLDFLNLFVENIYLGLDNRESFVKGVYVLTKILLKGADALLKFAAGYRGVPVYRAQVVRRRRGRRILRRWRWLLYHGFFHRSFSFSD